MVQDVYPEPLILRDICPDLFLVQDEYPELSNT